MTVKKNSAKKKSSAPAKKKVVEKPVVDDANETTEVLPKMGAIFVKDHNAEIVLGYYFTAEKIIHHANISKREFEATQDEFLLQVPREDWGILPGFVSLTEESEVYTWKP